MSGFRQPGQQGELIVTTAAALAVTAHDAGKTVCNVGSSTNLTLTFDSAATFRPGDQVRVLSCAATTVTCAFTAGQLITFNNVAATSVALSTSSEIIGGGFLFTCVSGAKWHCSTLCEETQTVTVA